MYLEFNFRLPNIEMLLVIRTIFSQYIHVLFQNMLTDPVAKVYVGTGKSVETFTGKPIRVK